MAGPAGCGKRAIPGRGPDTNRLEHFRRPLEVPRPGEVDAAVANRHAFPAEQAQLAFALGHAPVRAHDPVPRKPLGGRGEDLPDHPRGVRIDVTVCADETLRDGADAGDDAVDPRTGQLASTPGLDRWPDGSQPCQPTGSIQALNLCALRLRNGLPV